MVKKTIQDIVAEPPVHQTATEVKTRLEEARMQDMQFRMLNGYDENCQRHDGLMAELLRDNLRIWEESDTMRHCLYRSYREKIKSGKYIAYHVTAPHLGFRTGFTAGYNTKNPIKRLVDETVEHGKEYRITQEWKLDQVRGKANSTCPDRGLQDFCDMISRTLTDAYSRNITEKEFKY